MTSRLPLAEGLESEERSFQACQILGPISVGALRNFLSPPRQPGRAFLCEILVIDCGAGEAARLCLLEELREFCCGPAQTSAMILGLQLLPRSPTALLSQRPALAPESLLDPRGSSSETLPDTHGVAGRGALQRFLAEQPGATSSLFAERLPQWMVATSALGSSSPGLRIFLKRSGDFGHRHDRRLVVWLPAHLLLSFWVGLDPQRTPGAVENRFAAASAWAQAEDSVERCGLLRLFDQLHANSTSDQLRVAIEADEDKGEGKARRGRGSHRR